MTTTAELRSHTKSELSKMAKQLGVEGIGSMLKEDLVKAVAKASRANERASKNKKTSAKAKTVRKDGPAKAPKKLAPAAKKAVESKVGAVSKGSGNSAKPATKVIKSASAKTARAPKPKPKAKPTNPRVLKRIRELQLKQESSKDVAFTPTLVRPPGATEPIWEKEPQKDRVALFVRDAYWMHATWDITRQAIERARAAMAEQWHGAKPVLRVLRLEEAGGSSETVERDIEIHGGLRDWYIDWPGEEARCRVMVGYLGKGGRFHSICESNVIKMPEADSGEDVDEHWTTVGNDAERIYALSGGYDKETQTGELKNVLEARLHRELGAPALAKLGAAPQSLFNKSQQFFFDMDIELVVYGSTVPDGYLTMNGEPVKLRDDGTFSLRVPFPDRRQVLPAVACTRDGSQEQMIVVAVERNTKVMETTEREAASE
ncbi:MAG: DUF4912 domain-containing protein [Pirellulaceae bacterium]